MPVATHEKAVRHAGVADLKRPRLPVPDRNDQERIRRIPKAACTAMALLEKKLAALHEPKKGLKQALLTGQICVSVKERTHA